MTDAHCGHSIPPGEDTRMVALAGWNCDAIEGFVPCVEYFEYCRPCAKKARRWKRFIKDEDAMFAYFKAAEPQSSRAIRARREAIAA